MAECKTGPSQEVSAIACPTILEDLCLRDASKIILNQTVISAFYRVRD